MSQAIGIDVSHYQQTIDFAKVASAGYSFASIKATEGVTELDTSLAKHWASAGASGLLRGSYHFFRSTSDPLAQMRRFVEELGKVEAAHGAAEIPPTLDVEWQSAAHPLGALSPEAFANSILAAITELAKLCGRRPLIYTAPGFTSLLPHRDLAAVADLWIASYRSTPPSPIHGWAKWHFWQYSSTAVVPGCQGQVDVDRFCGTVEELKAYANYREFDKSIDEPIPDTEPAPVLAPPSNPQPGGHELPARNLMASYLFGVAKAIDRGEEGLS